MRLIRLSILNVQPAEIVTLTAIVTLEIQKDDKM